MKTEDRFDLPQGTLDLLIMRVVALGPIHGYAIRKGFSKCLARPCRSNRDPFIPLFIALNTKSCGFELGAVRHRP
jgi:hypothetical protein